MSVCVTAAGEPIAVPSAGAWSVDTITDAAAFDRLEPEWNDVVMRAGLPHPFLRHEWLRTWWECFSDERRLHIVIVRSGARIIAIAPLIQETAWMCGMPVRRLRLMHNDHTPRADVIVAEQPERAYRAIWTALADARAQWDVLLLGQLPRDSRTHVEFSRLAESEGGTIGVWQSSDSPYLALSGTWESYLASVPGKFRQNIRNRIARLRRLGEPALETIDAGPAIDDALADVVRLEESGWKRGEGTAIASQAAVRRFYTLLAHRAAACGWLRLLFLTIDGRRIATSYSLCYERRLFLCKTGYDPALETCSPFKVLTSFAIREAFESGLEEVDFLGDTEPWKREWTSSARSHDWLYVFSTSHRARLVYPLKFQVVPAVRSIVRSAGLSAPRTRP